MKGTTNLIATALVAQSAWSWELTPGAAFRDALSKNDMSLVAFLTLSTDATTSLETEWAAISKSPATLLSIDCSADKSLCSELDVVSFPAIRLYRQDGSMLRYRGPRRTKPIESFLNRIAKPAVNEVADASNRDLLASDDIVIIAQVAANNDETLFEERFRETAERYVDRFTFALSAAGTSEANSLQCYNNIDSSSFRTTELASHGAIEAFVKRCSSPLIPELTRRNELTYLSTGKSLVYYFSPSINDRESWTNAVRNLARSYAEYLTFVTVDSASYLEMVTSMGVPGGISGSGLSVSNPRMGQIFPLETSGSSIPAVPEVEKFIVAISKGQVQPWDGVLRQADAEPKQADQDHDEL